MSKHSRKRGAHAPRAHDECVDPDIYFSDRQDPTQQRKTDQLRVAIRRALTAALDCDVDDPLLEDLHVQDVLAEPGGVFVAVFSTSKPERIDLLQARLREAAPVFRSALATGLTRKRLPQVTFYVVPEAQAEVDDE